MRTQADFSVGKRNIPWWAASAAIAAGEVSALTLVGLPAAGFRGNWTALQVLVGATAARLLVAFFLLPVIYGASSPSVYGWLRRELGPRSSAAATILFFALRILAGSARFMAAAIAVSALTGGQLWEVLFFMTPVAAAILAWGGVRAVVWMGVAQTLAAVAAAGAVVFYLVGHVDGGLSGIWQLAAPNGLELARISTTIRFFADPDLLWTCVLAGLFGGAAAFGADQELAQRILCARSLEDSQRALVASVVWGALTAGLYLFLGAGLFAFYRLHPGLSLPDRFEHVYPNFAATALPLGLKILVLVSILLVAVDLPLVSLATVFVCDVYRPLNPKKSERHYLFSARAAAVFFAAWLGVMAWVFARAGSSLGIALKIGGVASGPLLGAFVVALRFDEPSDRATALAMGATVAVCAALLILSQRGLIALASPWLVVYGALGVVGLSWGLAPLLESEK